jgi:hypothetical protein
MSMTNIFDHIKDISLMLPDGVLYGSFFMGLITLSQQHIVLFLSLLEGLLLLSGFQSVASFMNGNRKIDPEKACNSKFHSITFSELGSVLRSDSISYGVYLLALASSYFVSASNVLKPEYEVLDSSYMTRSYVTMILVFSITLLYAFFRIYTGCESITSVLIGLFLGVIVGYFLVYQNTNLLNKNTINFLGIPLLRNKTADNEPIYICSQ